MLNRKHLFVMIKIERKIEKEIIEMQENGTVASTSLLETRDVPEGSTPNVRRSARIKSIRTHMKMVQGHGSQEDAYVNVKSRWRSPSVHEHEAEVEKEVPELREEDKWKLKHFIQIRKNIYQCERYVCKQAKKMLCDCFEDMEHKDLGCGDNCLNRLLKIECGSKCVMGERCTNRRFQNYQYSQCRVFSTEKKGLGVMAVKPILTGNFVMEYVGEVLNLKQFEERVAMYSKDNNMPYFMTLRKDAIIDATAKGNISRYINHSCDPNTKTQKWTVNGESCIGFFAMRDIFPGQEITINYHYQRYGKKAEKCYCQAENCRGWIGEEPHSSDEEDPDDKESEVEVCEEAQKAPVEVIDFPQRRRRDPVAKLKNEILSPGTA